MKIVQLISRRQLRGAEVFAMQLCEALVVRGHDVWLMGLGTPDIADALPGSVRCMDLMGTLNSPISPALFGRWLDEVRHIVPDVVQANGFMALKYAALARKVSAASGIVVYRNISIAGRWLRFPWQRVWGRWLLRSVDHVASVSDQSRQDFQRQYGVPQDRISTIRRGVHVPNQVDRAAARAQLLQLGAWPEDAGPVLVHVGSLTAEKNHAGLLRAFAKVREQFPNCVLLLLGDGPLHGAIKQQIRQVGLPQHVTLAGVRPEAAELLAGADLLLLTSHVEGVPGVVLEAAARGVPSVATDVGGVAEAVVGNQTGVLVRAGDDEAFAQAVAQLLQQPARITAMGRAAREFVATHYSLDRAADEFEALYRKLAQQSG